MATISHAAFPLPSASVDDLADCARVALQRDGRTILSYGSPSGYGPLREWIADRHGVAPERVFLTNGSLQGFFAQRLARGTAGAGRAADLRPPAEDPARARRTSSCSPATTTGSIPTRSSGLCRGPPPAFLHPIPDVPEPRAAARSARNAAAGSSSWPPSMTCSCWKTIRTASCATRR